MVAKTKKAKAKEPRQFGLEDMLKMLYTLLNTVGGEAKCASIPTKMLDQFPIDWMDRIAMREIDMPQGSVTSVYLKPRKGEKKKSILHLPPEKKLTLPPSCGG